MEQKQTQKQIADRILKLRKDYETASQEQRAEKLEIYSAYMGKMDEVQATPYETKESIPKLRTEVAYIKPFIFSGEPKVEFEGVGDEDKAISKIYEKIVNYRLETIPYSYEKIEAWVHQSVVFGTSFLKVIWRFATRKEIGTRDVESEEMDEDGNPIMSEEEYEYETPTVDEPDFDVPNILDVYYNPIIPNVNDQPCLVFRSILPEERVREDEMYDVFGEDRKLNRSKVKGMKSSVSNAHDSSSLIGSDKVGSTASDGFVEIFELVDDKRIQTCTGDGILLRDVENPYGFKNAVKLIHEPNCIPNRADGLGVGHNTLGLGKSYYKLFNQTLTSVKMTNNPMFATTKGAKMDKRQAVSKPGGVIELDTNGQPISSVFQPILFPDIKQGAIELLDKFDDEHKRASGANDLVQGSASNKTLGQDQISQTYISNRFEIINRRFKQALADVAEMILKMELKNLQSVDAPIMRIFPAELREQIFQVLTQADDVKYNIRIKGQTNIAKNKDVSAKFKENLFSLSQNFLTDKEKRAMLRSMAEDQGMDNIDDIIMANNPIADQQEQMALMQRQMGQAPMQGMTNETV